MDSQAKSAYEAAVKSHTLDLRRYWQIAARYKWHILLMVVLGGAAGLLLALVTPQKYVATSTLVIERPRMEASPAEAAYRFDVQTNEYFLTQFEVLKSDDLAFEVFRKLNVADHPGFRPAELPGPLQDAGQFLGGLIGRSGSGEENPRQQFGRFREALTVAPLTNTQAVKISFSSRDPELSAAVANALAQEYVQSTAGVLAEAAGQEVASLERAVEAARDRLQRSESALQEYRESENLVDIGGVQALPQRELTQISERLATAEQRYSDAQEVYQQVAHLVDGAEASEYLSSPLLAGDPQLQAAQTAYEAARQEYDSLSTRFIGDHPDISAAETQLAIARNALVNQAQTRVRAIRDQYLQAERGVADARARLEAVRGSLQNLNRTQFRLTELERQVEAERGQYESLLARVSNLRAVQERAPNSARVVDTAWPPVAPSGPGMLMLALIAAVLSGLLTLLWVFTRDALDDSIKAPEDVKNRLGLPLLGHMPKAQVRAEDVSRYAVLAEPYSFTAEAVHGLSAAVQHAAEQGSRQVLAVTSALPGEGKTTVALNLALAQAESCKTLLIDGSFLQPQLTRLIGGDPEQGGLLEVVEDQVSLERAIRTVPESDLHVLPLTERPANPQKLMARPEVAALMAELGRRYDRIIVDCGPVQVVSDAILWGRKADAVLLVAKAGDTQIKLIENAVTKLESCGKPIVGLVMNHTSDAYSPAFADYFSSYYSVAQQEWAAGEQERRARGKSKQVPALGSVTRLRAASE